MSNKEQPPVNVPPPPVDIETSDMLKHPTPSFSHKYLHFYSVYTCLTVCSVFSFFTGIISGAIFSSKFNDDVLAFFCIVGGIVSCLLLAALSVIVRACVKYINNEP